MSSRVDKILGLIDLEGEGLEIGPSYNPLLPKARGFRVRTVDHAPAAELREKYGRDPNVHDKAANIEEVDYVWRGEKLHELVGEEGRFDYIVASHVMEHITDPLGFLYSCERLLKPRGVLSVALPDKRYCFDFFRPHSTPGAILDAHFEGRRRHSPGAVFDGAMLSCQNGGRIAWGQGPQQEFRLTVPALSAWDRYQDARQFDDYIDAHGWQFTPSSFRLLLRTLHELGLTRLGFTRFHPTEGCEFIFGLSPSAPPPCDDFLELCLEIERELAATAPNPAISFDAMAVVSPARASRRSVAPWRALKKGVSLNGMRRGIQSLYKSWA